MTLTSKSNRSLSILLPQKSIWDRLSTQATLKSAHVKKVASLWAQGALGAFGPLKKVASLRAQRALGAFGPLNKSLRSGVHARNPPKWSATPSKSCPKWAASPPILGDSGHEIKGVVDHFGGFRAWIPERSDFFKGPKGPKGPLGPERSDLFKGPKGPKGPFLAVSYTHLTLPTKA